MRKNRILLLLLLLVSLFTLAACQGEAGVAGEKGPQGDKGLTGDTGATGDKGADGQNSKAPEFKVDNDGLQWRYEGEEAWNVIVTIPDLIGYSEKYTISFDANGGDALEPLANQVWKTTAQLPEATKEGYTFLGWQSLEEGAQEGDVYAENKFPSVQADVELTAVWGSTVSYAEETGKESVVLKAGEKTTLPAMEAPEGKTFLGWSYDGYTLEQAAAEITPDGNRHYAPIYDYTITYELNGGVGEATEEIKTAEIGKLQTPTKAGHVFQGWYKDAEFTQVVENKPVGDITLYAKWVEVTYVNYDLNGGTFAIAPYASIDAFAEEIVTLFKEAGGEVTTREEFQSLSHPNVKNVFNKAENLQKYQWLIQLALDAVNESGKADDETYGSGQTIATYKEMLTAMLNGDTNAINGSYSDGRSAFRQFIHRLINKDNAEAKGNTAYNPVTYDFAVAENLAKVNEIMGLPAPKYASVDEFAEEIVTLFAAENAETTRSTFQGTTGASVKVVFAKAENLQKYQWLIQLALDAVNESGKADDETYGSGQTIATYKEMLNAMLNGDTAAITGDYADGRTCFRQFIHRLINADGVSKGNTAYNPVTYDFAEAANMAKFNAAIGAIKQVVFSESAALATPRREGYVFAGWFDAEGKEVKSVTIGDGKTTINVTAKWLATTAVKFNADGGYIGFKNITDMRQQLCDDYNAFAGKSYTLETMTSGEWSPVDFHDWFASEGMTAKWTFLAQWISVNGGRTSTDKDNAKAFGKMLAGQTLDTNTDIYSISYEFRAFILGSVIREGHSSFGSTKYDEATLAEIWAAYEAATYSPVYTETTATPVAVKEGYIFAGWYDAQGNKVEQIQVGNSSTSLELTAKWQAAHTVSFDLNGGELPKEIAGDSLYTISVNVYKNGWSDDKPQFADAAIKDAGSSYIWAPKVFLVYHASINAYEVVEKAPADGASSIQGATSAWTHCLLYVSDTEYETIQVGQYFVADAEISVGCAPFKLSAYAGLAEAQTKFVYTEDVTELPVPTKEGFAFLGWFNGETKVESITIGTESATYTLVAKYAVVDPQENVAYKLAIAQKNLNKTLYLNGEMSGYYAATTETKADAVDVYFEAVEGGYNVYFMSGEAKKYINIVKSGNYLNIKFQDAASTVWAMDETYPTLVTTVETEKCYMGSYNNFNTFSCSKYSYAATSFPSFICE